MVLVTSMVEKMDPRAFLEDIYLHFPRVLKIFHHSFGKEATSQILKKSLFHLQLMANHPTPPETWPYDQGL